jgi:acetoin:2,6-dichlorophenolindophenol oxidoreductase subunit alpha
MLGTQAYRDKAEIEKWKDVCPIARFTKKLTDAGILTIDEAEGLRAEAQAEVDAAVEFAKKSPLPKPEAALDDVYSPAYA